MVRDSSSLGAANDTGEQMPLLLDIPLNMGAVDVNYTHIKIMNFTHNYNAIYLVVQHGTMSGNNFVQGKNISDVTIRSFAIQSDDYATIIATLTSATGVPIYDEVASTLYQWLIDKGHYSGTIV